MARTLCILPLIAVAAYLAWSPPEAAGSAPTTEAHSALPLVAVSPSDASDAGWPLDDNIDNEVEAEADVSAAAAIAARPKSSRGRPARAPAISAAPTAPSSAVASSAVENARDAATTDDTIAQPIDRSIDRASDDSNTDRNIDSDTDRDSAGDDANQQADENTGGDPDARPATAPVRRPLNSDLRALSTRVRRVLNTYYKRQLNSRDHNPWEMMHAIIAYGVHTKIHRGGPKAPTVNAVSYLCWNGTCHGLELLYLDKNRVNARKGPYVQGHYAQLLAILAQSRVPKDYPLRVGDRKFTIADLIETEKLTCDEGMELTFKLIAFSHYCDSDMTWKNDKGEDWDIPRLIKEELKAPILSNAACGGTHRLTALAYAVRNRAKQGHEIDGAWLRAQKYLNDYHRYNFSLQNSDGSFSTEWFRRREARDDLDRRLQTSGHILEWFVYSLPEEQLTDPRVVKAVKYVAGILAAQPSREWEIGPLGHAIHALSLYDQRVFKAAEEGALPEPIAERRPNLVPPRRHQESSRHNERRPVAVDRATDAATEHQESEAEAPLATSSNEEEAAADQADDLAHAEPAGTALAAPVGIQTVREAPADSEPVVEERAGVERADTEPADDDTADDASDAPVSASKPGTEEADTAIAGESPVEDEPAESSPAASVTSSDDSNQEVPEVARRGLLRKPFARRPRAGETPATSEQGPANPPPASEPDQTPTDATTAEAESDSAARQDLEHQPGAGEIESGEFECAELPSEPSTSLPIAPPAAAEPSLTSDIDEPARVNEPTLPAEPATTARPVDTTRPAQTSKPTTSGEGPDLFGSSPVGVPRGEEAPSTETESAVGPVLGAPASIGDSFDNRRPSASGVSVDPPPALPEDEPAVDEPPVRQSPASQLPPRRGPTAPPVVTEESTAEESALDEFAPDESAADGPASDATALSDDVRAYDVRPDDGSTMPLDEPRTKARRSENDPTASPGAAEAGSSRRPRANSRYARPLPEYSTYPGGQTPPPHAPRRPLSGGASNQSNRTPSGRSNTAPSLRGSITPRELAPQGTAGSRSAAAARQPTSGPPVNQPPASRPPVNRSQSQSNSNRSMSGRSAAERPLGRSIWPWSEADRGGQSARSGQSPGNKRSGRGLFQGN